MEYRNLTEEEIIVLKNNDCISDSWNNILVKNNFLPNNIKRVVFNGDIKLGLFSETLTNYQNIERHSGLYDSTISNCEISDNVFVSKVGILSNYTIGTNTIINNINSLVVSELNSFGIGSEIEILNEGGGRELPLIPELSSQLAYIVVNYKHDTELQKCLKEMCNEQKDKYLSEKGTIGTNVQIINVKEITNVNVKDSTKIINATLLKNGTILSNNISPTYIGENVVAKTFIIQSGAKVDSSVNLENCLVGESTFLGKQYSAENSAFSSNCEGYHGEACSIFAGPYTVTHHKSTLLIASYFSFYNAGSGSNQSNHMYKLGPIHQGMLERGSKAGSFSYMLLPCKVGPFSVIIGKHFNNFDASDFPFSYINEEDGKSVLTPAMNLFTVGTKRDTEKWASRDKRLSADKLDKISFDLFSPFIVGRMLKASEILGKLYSDTPKEIEYVKYKGLHIPRLLLKICKKYYDLGIKAAISEYIANKIDIDDFNSLLPVVEEINNSDSTSDPEKWLDIGGLFISESNWKTIRDQITSKKISTVTQVNKEFGKSEKFYNDFSWKWYCTLIKQTFSQDSNVTIESMIKILEDCIKNKIKLLNMILKDAEKEFDSNSKIGYGTDGDETVKNLDFNNVRGSFEENKFVIQLKGEIEKTKANINKINELLNNEQNHLIN